MSFIIVTVFVTCFFNGFALNERLVLQVACALVDKQVLNLFYY